ncbi:HNH endonuclease [Plebeiibacterium marinum]|uniref:HNH endonuclease n=1 Tax=Plebeiibacterium marinum TaxID=2992111 RepID=A0AAE3SIU6_9BACT|nr:HNH endonuclease [Plebeiobacterium marinum]MCW3804803.1 HNH endonuclease [Plebeiobacterium marinum]
MAKKELPYYLNVFGKLRRDHKNGGAPHKPILLISLCEAIANGLINKKQIYISPEIVGLFKSNWNSLVVTNHQCLFALPFYHMNSEPFWRLTPNKGCELWVKSKSSMRSLQNLTIAINYAEIDLDLFEILQQKENNEIVKQFILDKYFPDTKGNYGKSSYLTDIESQIVNEDSETYSTRITELQKQLEENSYQEEIFVRSNVFKREIPKIYNQTCCISGLRIDSIINISMIDACHIIPFSESNNDTITNGLALCPNLHRAFDRGLISIDENYRVLISTKFSENKTDYSLTQFRSKQIQLPIEQRFYPSLENIRWHNINTFKG